MFSKFFDLSSPEWVLHEKGFNPGKLRDFETIFALGNGYMGHRASYEGRPEESDPATFIAGIFDKSEAMVPQLVKAPVWIDFSLWVGKEKFDLSSCRVLFNERKLDMKKGVLHRRSRLKASDGKIISVESKRVIFAHQVRGALMEVCVTPENFSGDIKVISGLNGNVVNVGYYPEEKVKHLNLIEMDRSPDYIYLEMKTRDNYTKIGLAASTRMKTQIPGAIKVNRMYAEKISEEFIFKAHKKKTYYFTKWAVMYTSREGYEKQLKSATLGMLQELIREGVDYQLKQHIAVRQKQWENADIQIKGDPKAQEALRFCIYHLIIAKPHHDPTVSLGAKFLTGEGYKGHTFWDTEIFMFPFYVYNFPETAAGMLEYRYYTLAGALKNARSLGYKGAKTAWESADTGEETTPKYGYMPDGTPVRIWTGEEELHIVSDIIYAIFNYYKATQDKEFLFKFGAEIVFQTARFWLTRVVKRRDRYEIRKVIGPDEFHEHVDNNAFTNYLVGWHMQRAYDLYEMMKKDQPDLLKQLLRRLKMSKKDFKEIRKVGKLIFLPYDQKTDLIEQFEGYFELEDITVKHWDRHGMPIIPHEKDLKLPRTQLLKQADVVLLMYMFLDKFAYQLKKKNYNYYEKRTLQRSSLSMCIYALMGLDIGDHKRAYSYFMKTATLDLNNLNKNVDHGVHGAAMGGAWQMAIHGFAGMKIRKNALSFDPWLPAKWKELKYNCFWRGEKLYIRINHHFMTLRYRASKKKSLTVSVQGKLIMLRSGRTSRIRLKIKK